MTEQQFLERARLQIPDQAYLRLTPLMRGIIANGNPIFDTHCHIFDKKCVNALYFILRTLSLGEKKEKANSGSLFSSIQSAEEVYDKLREMAGEPANDFDEDAEWDSIEQDIETMDQEESGLEAAGGIADKVEGLTFKGMAAAMRILFRGNMEDVLKHYLKHHAFGSHTLPELQSRDMVTSVIMMDVEKGWAPAKVKKSQRQQIQEIKRLTEKYPIIPYLAVDPRRNEDDENPHLFELFLDAFSGDDQSFFGVKTYPALGYHPADVRLKAIYQICEEKGIPVLTHCGGSIISTSKKTIEGTQFTKEGEEPYKYTSDDRRDLATQMNDPALWRDVLDVFPNLRLNVAHHGGGRQWSDIPTAQSSVRVRTVASLMSAHPNVYADFSFNLKKEQVDTYIQIIKDDPLLRSRAMFGTDYWVVLPQGNLVENQLYFMEQMKAVGLLEDFIANTPLKYYGLSQGEQPPAANPPS